MFQGPILRADKKDLEEAEFRHGTSSFPSAPGVTYTIAIEHFPPGVMTMRKFLLACAMLLIWPVTAFAGPKEEAFLVVEQFKKAFDASDVDGVVKLFASDAVFLGTVSPILATKTDQIDKYFQGLRQCVACSVTIEEYATIVVSENAVLFAGLNTFSRTRDGNVIKTPARFTLLIAKTDQGWRISHFHSSPRPTP